MPLNLVQDRTCQFNRGSNNGLLLVVETESMPLAWSLAPLSLIFFIGRFLVGQLLGSSFMGWEEWVRLVIQVIVEFLLG